MTSVAGAAESSQRFPHPWRSFVVCGTVVALTILDLSKINVGLPSIERSLGATDGELQLLVAGYVLAFGLSLVPAGRIGDVYSRKTMFMVGLALFLIASVVCAIAPSIGALLVGRVLQGVAAGIQMPQALGLTQQLFSGPMRARAFGYIGSIIAISTAVGPAVGGLLSQLDPGYGWRLLFWINAPIAAAALVAAARTLPRTRREPGANAEIDLVGLVLFGVAAVALMLPFVAVEGVSSGPWRWSWLLLCLASSAVLVVWERRVEAHDHSPVLPLHLVSLPSFRGGLLIMATFFSSVSAIFFVVALYLQDGRGVSPLVTGLVNVPQAITSALGAWIGSRYVVRLGRRLVLLGVVLVMIGVLTLVPVAFVTSPDLTPVLCSISLGIAGIGTGLVIAPNQTITIMDVPSQSAGVAASLTQVAQRIGSAIGLAAISAVYFAALSPAAGFAGYRDALIASALLSAVLLAASAGLAARDVLRTRARLRLEGASRA